MSLAAISEVRCFTRATTTIAAYNKSMPRGWYILFICASLVWAADPVVTAAQAALDAGDFARAADQAESAAAAFHSRHDPTDEALALNIAGSAHLRRGEYDLALERYQSALVLDRMQHDSAGEVTRLMNIGSVYFFRGRYLEALAEYQRGRDLGAGDRQLVLTNLAILYDQLGDFPKALEYYQEALAAGQTPALLEGAAGLYRRLHQPEKAADAYQRALAIRPSAQLWEELGITQAVDLKDLPAALKSFEQAVKT